MRAHYGEDRVWRESPYLERMYDQALAVLIARPSGWYYEVPPPRLHPPADDRRRKFAPWWRASLIVDR